MKIPFIILAILTAISFGLNLAGYVMSKQLPQKIASRGWAIALIWSLVSVLLAVILFLKS